MARKDKQNSLRRLDVLLQDRNGYTMEDLAKEIEVSLSSIKNYFGKVGGWETGGSIGIRNGEDWPESMHDKFDVEKDHVIEIIKNAHDSKEFLYRYVDGFTLFDDKLRVGIINRVIPFIEHVSEIHGLNNVFLETINDLMEILEDQGYREEVMKIVKQKKKSMRISMSQIENISIGNYAYDKMPEILKAIKNKIVLEILYQPFKRTGEPIEDPIAIHVHPYLLNEYNDRWYLIALVSHTETKNNRFTRNKRINKINILGLERINKVNERKDIDYINTATKINKILNQSIGPSI